MSVLVTAGFDGDVRLLVEEVWSSFLGAEEPVLAGPPSAFTVGWSAAVTISGPWSGIVSVELPSAAAAEIARRMLGLAPGDTATDEDVADAVGELVNMIGGNIKSLLPGPSTLSLPVVAAGRVARGSDTEETWRYDAVWAAHPFTIDVHAHHPGRNP